MVDRELRLSADGCEIIIRDEVGFTPNSTDNLRPFDWEYLFDEVQEEGVSSRHSVSIDCNERTVRSCILVAGGAPTTVHDSSAVVNAGQLLVAISNYVSCLSLPSLNIQWQTKTDLATCFGVSYSEKHDCYISHGEIEITRLNHQGVIVWTASGKDIFTGDFVLGEGFIEATDFTSQRYLINIDSGFCRKL